MFAWPRPRREHASEPAPLTRYPLYHPKADVVRWAPARAPADPSRRLREPEPAIPQAPAAAGLRYSAALDGLRALAVAAVLLYHASFSWIPGGFLGVEVFFVVSGYLTTSLLLSQWEREGRVALGRFWFRRVLRLVPAIVTLVVALLLYCAIALPGELARLRGDALAGLAFFTNWDLILGGESYFASLERPPLLRHFWSLSVEWHYYLLWPPVLALALRPLGRDGAAVLAIAGACASALIMALLYSPEADPSRIYYATDTRLSGLLLGAALALWWTPRRMDFVARLRPGALETAAALMAAALAWYAFTVGELDATLYQGRFAAAGLATALLIAALVHPSSRLLPRTLGWEPLRLLGLRSYSVYLWHWPVFALTQPRRDLSLDGWDLFFLRLAITLALAELSYRFVEIPWRTGTALRWLRGLLLRRQGSRRHQRALPLAAGAGCLAGTALLVAVALSADGPGLPSYLPAKSLHAVYEPAAPATSAPASPVDLDLVFVLAQLDSPPPPSPVLQHQPALDVIPDAEVPPPVDAASPAAAPPPPTTTQEPSVAPPASATAAEPPPPPPPPPPPRPSVRVSAVGDSVMLGAAAWLGPVLGAVEIDAAVSRQVSGGIVLLKAWRDAGTLGAVVVVHLGNNGTFTAGQFDQIMTAAGERRVVFVTVHVPRAWQDPNNAVIAAGVARHPNAALADWHTLAESDERYLYTDGIHLPTAGAEAYAALIASIVNGP